MVQGMAGFNTLEGWGGNDTLIGGDDGNVLNGGAGRDILRGGAGDAVAGERYFGGDGTDTIRLVAGGTGSVVDLSGTILDSIEAIEFASAMTLRLDNATLAAVTVTGTAATGEIVEVSDWVEAAGTADLAAAAALIDNGIDEVRWNYGGNAGSVVMTEQVVSLSGEASYVKTFTNDGPVDIALTSRESFYNQDLALFRDILNLDTGLQILSEYNVVTGAVLETTSFDLSAGGTAFAYEYVNQQFDQTGAMIYRLTQFDTGIMKEDVFTDGVVTYSLQTDMTPGGAGFNYDTLETFFDLAGVVTLSRTVFDAGQSFISQDRVFEDGALERTVSVAQNGTVVTLGINADQTFVATDADEIFDGRGGADTFVFAGDVGTTRLRDFGTGADLLDLTAYGVASRDDLETAGALTFVVGADRFIIDVALLGGAGTIVLDNMTDGALGNEDFVMLLV